MVRRFVEATLAIPGAVLSSTEIVAAAQATGAASVVVQRLAQVLAAVDAVRFGGKIPTDAESREVLELMTRVLSLGACLSNRNTLLVGRLRRQKRQ
jgi:hypothetical protein